MLLQCALFSDFLLFVEFFLLLNFGWDFCSCLVLFNESISDLFSISFTDTILPDGKKAFSFVSQTTSCHTKATIPLFFSYRELLNAVKVLVLVCYHSPTI